MVYIKFANQQKLKKHVDSGMAYIKFTNPQKLKKHVDTVHKRIKPFKFSTCDVKFANNYNP